MNDMWRSKLLQVLFPHNWWLEYGDELLEHLALEGWRSADIAKLIPGALYVQFFWKPSSAALVTSTGELLTRSFEARFYQWVGQLAALSFWVLIVALATLYALNPDIARLVVRTAKDAIVLQRPATPLTPQQYEIQLAELAQRHTQLDVREAELDQREAAIKIQEAAVVERERQLQERR